MEVLAELSLEDPVPVPLHPQHHAPLAFILIKKALRGGVPNWLTVEILLQHSCMDILCYLLTIYGMLKGNPLQGHSRRAQQCVYTRSGRP